MKRQVILDPGPLVAYLNSRDKYHEWALLQWAAIEPPLLTCEPVLSEACFLLGGIEGGQTAIMELVRRRIVHIPFRLIDHVNEISMLLDKYSDLPMSLADGCLVRMAELYPEGTILTLDEDFVAYRKNKTRIIPTLLPPSP